MTRPRHHLERSAMALVVTASLTMVGCGEDEPVVASRGAPGAATAPTEGSRRTQTAAPDPTAAAGQPGLGEDAPVARPDRPSKILTRDDFSSETRDPFRNYNEVDNVEVTPDAPRERQREVRMADVNFEDLTLIGIVHSGRDVRPRALWVGTDGKSKTIKQGEYFSRAEVLLAAVNRDYVEIEVVDDELARGLNMERGERRAIYLKQD